MAADKDIGGDTPKNGNVRKLWVILLVASVALVAGVLAGRFVRSPADQAADSAAPPLSPVTDSVQKGQVSSSVAVAATMVAANTTPVMASQGSAVGSVAPVVTGIRVRPGVAVRAGQVVLEVSGRPVIVLPGSIPAYRTLNPGDSGPDVQQLIRALGAAGFTTTDRTTIGPSTVAQITALYKADGYAPVATGQDQLTSTRSALNDARDAQFSADDALAQATQNLQAAIRSTQTPQSASSAPSSSTDRDSGGAAATQATTPASAPAGDAGSVDELRHAVQLAKRAAAKADAAVASASAQFQQAQAHAGASVPLGEVVFVPSLPARVQQLQAHVGSQLQGAAMQLVSGNPVAEAKALDPAAVRDVKVNMAATIMLDDGTNLAAHVTQVGAATDTSTSTSNDSGSQSQNGQQVDVVITPDRAAKGNLMGNDVRAVVHVSSTQGEVLNVATGAIVTDSTSTSYVRKRNADGSLTTITVSTGAQGDGRVAITPTSGGKLTPGDSVLVGTDTGPSAPQSGH